MKAFSFELEKVLRLRKYREDEAKIELGRATGILSELEAQLLALGKERVRAAEAQFNPQNSAAEMRQYMFYLMRLDAAKENLLEETARAELQVEEARAAFLEASRERKILDTLKEKREKEYRKEALALETKILDDIKPPVL